VRFVAFYLPQYHPQRENDEWWGSGFTDWRNVVQGRPMVRGQYQPHLPADLGFYDLRLPEVRSAQASLAAAHEIDAFCYYHYWFHGRRILERPFAEVLASGEPEFPFCLCWANENWTRTWNGGTREVLLRQTYSASDDTQHIRWLLEPFADRRYVKIDGRPVFLVYRPSELPDARRTTDTWRREAARLGAGELYLCAVHNFATDRQEPSSLGFDAAVQFAPDWTRMGARRLASLPRRAAARVLRRPSPYQMHRFYDYGAMVAETLEAPRPGYLRFPGVSPGFDCTARRRTGGAIVVLGSDPDLYGLWLDGVLGRFDPPSPDENLVFVNAWNEWAEGNHLEPDLRWGRAFLDAHARVARWHDPGRARPRLARATAELRAGTDP
jgi:hypothetical protein